MMNRTIKAFDYGRVRDYHMIRLGIVSKKLVAVCIGLSVFGFCFALPSAAQSEAQITYQAHVSNVGWMSKVSDGTAAGQEMGSNWLEAVRVQSVGYEGVRVEGTAHVSDIGWMPPVGENAVVGTIGRAKPLEAVRLSLEGENASDYDIWYQVCVRGRGWLGWAKNGEDAGTQGYALPATAIRIKVCPAGTFAPENTKAAFDKKGDLQYAAHISNIGWMGGVANGAVAGQTTGSNWLEAIRIKNIGYEGVRVMGAAHVSDIGWMSPVGENAVVGTIGRAKPIEAVRLSLEGDNASDYDIWYQVCVRGRGWLGWAKNGESAGTQGYALPATAIRIKVCRTGTFAPQNSVEAFDQKTGVVYSAYAAKTGWTGNVKNGAAAGSETDAARLEAFRLQCIGYDGVHIQYAAHVADIGWMAPVGDHAVAGKPGKGLEAVRISLGGKNAALYDVWYRVRVQGKGWLGWARNGENAGTQGYALPITALSVRICPKDTFAPDPSQKSFLKPTTAVYAAYVENAGWSNAKQYGTSGTTGKARLIQAYQCTIDSVDDVGVEYTLMEGADWLPYTSETAGKPGGGGFNALRMRLTGADAGKYDIIYRVHVSYIGWLGWAMNDQATGSEGYGLKIEAIQAAIVEKGSQSVGNKIFYQKQNAVYEIQNGNEWLSGYDNRTCGAPGGEPAVGFRMWVEGVDGSAVSYEIYTGAAWSQAVGGGVTAGDGENPIEAIKIKLSEPLAAEYRVYYRVSITGSGWMPWTSDGQPAGSIGYGKSIEAIEITLVEKGVFTAPATGNGLYAPRKHVFALDAGHGPGDPGAIRVDGGYEANDNLKIANEVARVLRQQGQTVVMLDRSFTASNRARQANAANADVLVSLHRDSVERGNTSGITIYTHEHTHTQQVLEPDKEYAPNEYPNRHAGDDRLTQGIARYLNEVPNPGIRGIVYGSATPPTYQDYLINRLANMPSCIVELGFVTNASDNRYFDTYYKQYAKAIAGAMMETVGLTFNDSLYTA